MKGGVKILGHSVHPILIVFPLGLLATGVVFDVIYLIWGNVTFSVVAYWMITAGLVGGALAAIFGWLDWFAIPSGTRAKSIGLIHGLVNATALVIFAASWWFRNSAPAQPPALASGLSILGAGLALVGGWLGGELVERLGVGVHEGAHLNAPSSLSTDSALSTENVFVKE
ncbi:MAG: DUF2231 domain-containing protein [Saprospiraceae bacterium]|nr:DUF2231 domain-containing protein [Pyrinomonadaceae bacterium]